MMEPRDKDVRWPLARRITLLFVATLTIMAGTTIAPALPDIENAFRSVDRIELLSRMVLTLPSIFVAMSAPLAGIMADRFGRKKLLAAAVLLYALAGMSGLFVDSITALLVGRAALGLAIGAIMTIGTALVGDYFEGAERERYLGLQQAFTQIGGVAFVIGGGLLADISWRAPFAVYGAALLVLPAVLVFLNEPKAASRDPSPGSLPELVNADWGQVALICLMAFIVNASFYTIPSQLPFHLRSLGVEGASSAGMAIGMFNFAAAVTALSYSRVRGWLDTTALFAVGPMFLAIGFWLVSGAGAMGSVLFALAVMGVGLGLTMPNLISAAIASAPAKARGRIAGVVTSSMFLGHFVSPFASQPWIARFGYGRTFRDVGFILAAMALVAAIAFVVRRANGLSAAGKSS